MTLRRILVHTDDSDLAKNRVAASLTLAQKHDAHLTGAAIEVSPVIPTYAMAHTPTEVYAALAEEQKRRAEVAGEIFGEAVSAADWSARSDFKSARGDVARTLAHFGRTADLVVISQGIEDSDTEEMPDNLILESGAPILVLPKTQQSGKMIGDRILLAWTDSRESARAMRDAMPLLQSSSAVEILSITEADETVEMSEVARHLAAHGITAETNGQPASDLPVEAALLNRAFDGGFDTIVCGGYGHSRLRETVLGGVTRGLLRSSPVPVLMSH